MLIEGTFQDTYQVFNGIIKSENGKITEVKKSTTEKIDLNFDKSRLIIPMIVDLHTHLRWGQPNKEDYICGGQAALKGGVGVVWDMPNNPNPPHNSEIFKEKLEAAKQSPIDVRLFGAIKPNGQPFPETEFYKIYTESVGTEDLHFTTPETIDDTLRNFRGKYVAAHCDDYQILQQNKGKSTHKEQRPPEAEQVATKYMCDLFTKYKIHGNICHISSKKTLRSIPAHVTKEVTLHHLLWNTETVEKVPNAEWIKMNPPLPYPKDQKALLRAVKSCGIEYLVSDHAPHTLEEKQDNNPSGVPWLEFFAPAMALISETHNIPMKALIRMCSHNPGRFMSEKRGVIMPDYDASFVVLNYDKPLKVTNDSLISKCGWSPLEGLELPCSVEAVIIGDRVYNP